MKAVFPGDNELGAFHGFEKIEADYSSRGLPAQLKFARFGIERNCDIRERNYWKPSLRKWVRWDDFCLGGQVY